MEIFPFTAQFCNHTQDGTEVVDEFDIVDELHVDLLALVSVDVVSDEEIGTGTMSCKIAEKCRFCSSDASFE